MTEQTVILDYAPPTRGSWLGYRTAWSVRQLAIFRHWLWVNLDHIVAIGGCLLAGWIVWTTFRVQLSMAAYWGRGGCGNTHMAMREPLDRAGVMLFLFPVLWLFTWQSRWGRPVLRVSMTVAAIWWALS